MVFWQVVNSADLEGILGPRPWRSNELRNIDKFRDGFGTKSAVVDVALEVLTRCPASSSCTLSHGGTGLSNILVLPCVGRACVCAR